MDKISVLFIGLFVCGTLIIAAYAASCAKIGIPPPSEYPIEYVVTHIPPNSTPLYCYNNTLYVYRGGCYHQVTVDNGTYVISKKTSNPRFPPAPVGYIQSGRITILATPRT